MRENTWMCDFCGKRSSTKRDNTGMPGGWDTCTITVGWGDHTFSPPIGMTVELCSTCAYAFYCRFQHMDHKDLSRIVVTKGEPIK